MPEWQEEELQLLKSEFIKDAVPDVTFWDKFQKIGGIPRKLVSNDTSAPESLFPSASQMLEALIKMKDPQMIRNIVTKFMAGQAVPDGVDGSLITYVEQEYRYRGLRFASDYVRDTLVKEWQKKNERELKDFIGSASNDPNAAGLAGHLFEGLAHIRFERKSADQIQLCGGTCCSASRLAWRVSSSTTRVSLSPLGSHAVQQY